MGFFKKKDSRSTLAEANKSLLRPQANAERLSDFSIKSPTLVNNAHHPKMVTSIPDVLIPHPPDPVDNPAAYLRSIQAVRQRTKLVLEKAKANQLNHFDVDMTKFPDTADYVVSIIKVQVFDFHPEFMLIRNSEILLANILQYRPTDDGNTSKSEADRESPSFYSRGPPTWIIRNELVASSISS